MGILKGIIDRFRAMGKSEKEISSIIETAADKATANPDVTKPEKPKKPEIKICLLYTSPSPRDTR